MYLNQSHCVSWPGEARPIKNPGNVGYDCLTRATGRKGEQERRKKSDLSRNVLVPCIHYKCTLLMSISPTQMHSCLQRPDLKASYSIHSQIKVQFQSQETHHLYPPLCMCMCVHVNSSSSDQWSIVRSPATPEMVLASAGYYRNSRI